MKNIQNLTIDINKKTFQTITANVGEVASRFIKITILENNMPADLTGVTAYLYAKKADGTKVFNSVTIENAKQGIVLAELTSQVLAIAGLVKLTLLLTKDGAKLASKQIIVTVDESAIDESAIESTNEFNALTDALKKVNNIASRFENVNSQLEHNEKKIGNRFNAIKKFNLKGDGTDETENFLSMINLLKDDDEVVFPKGIYYIPNWKPISSDKKIQWFGENGTVIKSNKSNSFLNVNNDINFKNISFEGFNGLIVGKGISEKVNIEINDCNFNEVGTVISIPSTEIGLNSLNFSNNKVDNKMKGYGLHISCPFENVLIANNTFKNMQTRCITLGEDNNIYEDDWKKAIITNNFIDNVYATGSNSCYGVLCYGKELMVSNNIISNIDSESMDNCEGIYFKGRYSMITNNILIDAGRHEASIAI